jgi:hypothetical protein
MTAEGDDLVYRGTLGETLDLRVVLDGGSG